MTSTRCFCGLIFDGDDDDHLVDVMCDHLQEAHRLAVGPVMARNAIERQRMLGPIPKGRAELGAVIVSPVSAETTADFLDLFDSRAFTDNVGWASCYCMFHHLDPATWEARSWEQNRTEMIERLSTGATTGLLASVDGVVAGWVNAGRLAEYPTHRHGDERDTDTGAIVCFVVGPEFRGHGLGSRLLDAACDLLAAAGLTGVEAYPSRHAGSAAQAYHGTPEMYRRAGFEPIADGVVFRTL